MKKSDVIRHYGSKSAVARALGITPQAVSLWGARVPELRAYQIEQLTCGALKRDPTERPCNAAMAHDQAH